MNKLLTFIIPAYNAEKYIKNCIKSILKINSDLYDVVVINDGSNDKTEGILNEFKDYDQISIINQKNLGVSAARNSGLKIADGKYVTFIDSDDIVCDKWYTDNLKELSSHCENIIFFDYYKNSNNQNKIKKRPHLSDGINNIETAYKLILDGSFNNVWDNLYLNKTIQLNNIKFKENMKLGEDVCFNIDFINNSEIAYYYPEPIYCYNVDNSTSAMHKYKIEHIKDYCILFDEYNKIIHKYSSIDFSVGLRHYISRLFGSLYYGERLINNSEYNLLINSFFYKTIMASNKNFGISDYIKKILISSKFYRNKFTRKIIVFLTKTSVQ